MSLNYLEIDLVFDYNIMSLNYLEIDICVCSEMSLNYLDIDLIFIPISQNYLDIIIRSCMCYNVYL